MKTFLAYVSLYSGSFWATRPLTGEEPHLEKACAVLAETLADDVRYFSGTQLAARLRSDGIALSRALDSMGFAETNLSGHTDRTLDLLHVVRLALFQHAFLIAARLPAHSADRTLTRSDVIRQVLALDFAGAAAAMKEADSSNGLAETPGLAEAASYPEAQDETAGDATDHGEAELAEIGRFVHLISVGIANHFGAVG